MIKNYAISILVFAGAMLMMGIVWPEPEPQFTERYIITDRGCNSCHELGGDR